MPTKRPEQPEAAPLYYAILCGFRWLIEHLIVTYPGDVNARGGCYGTPLLAAVRKNGDTSPLHRAWHRSLPSECVDIVRLLLEHDADVNLPDQDRATPLHYASASGKLEVSQLLVRWGADVNSQDEDDCTPLQIASDRGHLDIARLLIDNGADVNACNNEGSTHLHIASWRGRVNIVELLTQRGADVNKPNDDQVTPLDLASTSGKLEISQLLVQRGADVCSRDSVGRTPLRRASEWGHLDVVRFLIDSGADVNFGDDQDWTPLDSAASKGHHDVVKLLLECGADFSIRTDGDRMPLDLASDNVKPEVANSPSGHMMSLDDTTNTTPSTISPQNRHPNVLHPPGENATSLDNEQHHDSLYTASQNGQLDIVRSLLDRGSDINKKSTFRATPLDAASRYGKLEVAKLLIERGADVDSRDRNGRSPLITALVHEQFEVAKLLLDHRADVNVGTRNHYTALHVVLYSGHLEIIRLLLERGANVDVPDVDGQTPKQLAIQLGYRKIAEMLSGFEEHGQGVIVEDAPTSHSARASTLGISACAPVPVSAPPALATQSAADSTSTSVSSHSETAWHDCDDKDTYRDKSVDGQSQPMIKVATPERNEAAKTAQWASWALITSPVLIGATALGAALRGKNKLAATLIPVGVSTFLAFYLARTFGSNERRASLLRVKAPNHFVREAEVSQLDHAHEVRRERGEKIVGFRLGMKNMSGNQPGSVTINPEASGTNSGLEKVVGTSTNPVSVLSGTGDMPGPAQSQSPRARVEKPRYVGGGGIRRVFGVGATGRSGVEDRSGLRTSIQVSSNLYED
ncbi:ankyrin repeat-containing domain protein [Lactarius hengduanensis]|nr:ankyrin repeat-containing domain protein [Lactarius hengduanensis]